MATVDVLIDGERHRYQLLKTASTTQLDVHASVIRDLTETAVVEIGEEEDLSPPGPISSY